MLYLHQVLCEVEGDPGKVADEVDDDDDDQDDGLAPPLPLLLLQPQRRLPDPVALLNLLEDEGVDDQKGEEGEDSHD